MAYYFVAVAGLTVLTGLNGQISLGHGALMAVGAYATAKLLDARRRWPLAAVLVGRARSSPRSPARSPGRRPRGCAGPTSPARRSRWRSGCRRSRRSSSGFLGAIERAHGRAADPAARRSARRSRSSAGRRGSPAWPRSLAYVVLANLVRSGFGRAFRAVRDDEVAAQLAGFHVARTQVLAFVVSSACAGLAGGLLVVVTSLAAPGAFPLALSVALLTGVILGGTRQPGRRGLGRSRAGAGPTWADERQQGAVAVAQRPGNLRAGHLRRRAHRRDARAPRRHPGGAARPEPAAPRLLGTTIARLRAAREGGGEVMRSTTTLLAAACTAALALGACGSSNDSGGSQLELVAAASRPPRPPASLRPRSPSAATSRSPGPAAPGYSEIPQAIDAYFKYVNANGGVNGRKLKMIARDDGYNPTNTVKVTKQLVLQDKIFAMLGGLGTPTHTKVVDYLNASRVPDLFVSSGCLCWDQPKEHPYTFGWQPDYIGRGQDPRPVHRPELQGQEGRLLPARTTTSAPTAPRASTSTSPSSRS